jgi:DNA-binding transcriptional regulator YhcF (GntR family)
VERPILSTFLGIVSQVVTFASGLHHNGFRAIRLRMEEVMLTIGTEAEARMRLQDFAVEDRAKELADEKARRGNRGFVQVYPKGWKRLQALLRSNPSAARVYAFLAEHIDGACGAVVVSQDVIAKELDVHERTIRRLTQQLEESGALVRIKVGTGVYAYALDPEEVWRSWDQKKETAAFVTKTLVLKTDRANGQIRRKLKVMLGEPELPLD